MPEDTTPPADSSSVPIPCHWWKNEDWLAVLAAAPLMAAVLHGWKVMLPTFAWTGAGDAAGLVSASNLQAMAVTSVVPIVFAALVLAASLGKRVLPFLAWA